MGFGHAFDVLGKRGKFSVARRLEQEQIFQAVFGLGIEHGIVHADFERTTEFAPKSFVLVALVLEHDVEPIQNRTRQALADDFYFVALLKEFARNVQRQVGRIDQTFDEAQPVGQKIFALVHDEDVPRIQLQSRFVIGVIQILRGVRGNAHERGVFDCAFRFDVENFLRRLPLVHLLFEEFVVLFARDFGFTARPKRLHGIDRANFNRRLVFGLAADFKVHLNRVAHEVGIFFDEPFKRVNVGEIIFVVVLEVQDNRRAVRRFFAVFQFVFARARRSPLDGGIGARLARDQFDFFGNDERAVKSYAELPDKFLRGRAACLAQLVEKIFRAAFGDCADVADNFVARHADSVVAHGNCVRCGVGYYENFGFGVVFQVRVRERFNTQLVQSVAGVADEFAQKNFLVRVNRIDNQIKQTFRFRLELQLFNSHKLFVSLQTVRRRCRRAQARRAD